MSCKAFLGQLVMCGWYAAFMAHVSPDPVRIPLHTSQTPTLVIHTGTLGGERGGGVGHMWHIFSVIRAGEQYSVIIMPGWLSFEGQCEEFSSHKGLIFCLGRSSKCHALVKQYVIYQLPSGV